VRLGGGRATPQRQAILQVIAETGGHLTAHQAHRAAAERGHHLERSTVHRTLTSFVEVGVVHAVYTTAGAAFGLANFEHIHGTCGNCGETWDVPANTDRRALARLVGVAESDAAITVAGLCRGCHPSS
jgi:Fur family ferric uptake transcriptional regulator